MILIEYKKQQYRKEVIKIGLFSLPTNNRSWVVVSIEDYGWKESNVKAHWRGRSTA
jgi:hypothetical protein